MAPARARRCGAGPVSAEGDPRAMTEFTGRLDGLTTRDPPADASRGGLLEADDRLVRVLPRNDGIDSGHRAGYVAGAAGAGVFVGASTVSVSAESLLPPPQAARTRTKAEARQVTSGRSRRRPAHRPRSGFGGLLAGPCRLVGMSWNIGGRLLRLKDGSLQPMKGFAGDERHEQVDRRQVAARAAIPGRLDAWTIGCLRTAQALSLRRSPALADQASTKTSAHSG